MAYKAKLIDVTLCTGCRGCEVACKEWNVLPAQVDPFKDSYQTHTDTKGKTWTIVKFVERFKPGTSKVEWLFRKHQCLHCLGATCLPICPHQAISRTTEGAVIVDWNLCDGCGDCFDHCPFGVPKLAWWTGYTKERPGKCKLCYDRIANGLTPICAKTCPSGAIKFGDRDTLLAEAAARVNEIKSAYPDANVYGDNEMQGTCVIYVLAYDPTVYGLPLDPTDPAEDSLLAPAPATT